MSEPASYSPSVYQGAAFTYRFRLRDNAGQLIDFTDLTVSPQIRLVTKSSTTVIADFSTTGSVTIDADGWAVIKLTSTETRTITPNVYQWDIWITDTSTADNDEAPYVIGTFTVKASRHTP